MSILEIQKALKAAGFDPGPLDGKDGPRTHAALLAFQKAHGIAEGSDFAATQAALGGGSASAAGGVGAQTEAAIAAKYPDWGWLINDPEVGALLRKGLPADQLEQQIKTTNWYRTRTEQERNYLALAALDPKEATRQLNNYDAIGKYMADAGAMGITVSFDAAARQADRVVRGEIAPDALAQELRNMAKNLYGWDSPIGKAIDRGQTVADVFEPYKQLVVQTLGLNPADVRLDDPKWNALLSVDGPDAGKRLPTQDEVARRLRTDEKYGFSTTQSGRDESLGALNAVSDTFGFGKLA